MKRIVLLIFFVIGLLGLIPEVHAQIPNISIEALSDQQIIGLMTQYQLLGLSELELEMKAREKGLSMEQINQLKKRVALIDFSTLKEGASMGTGMFKSAGEDSYTPRNRIKSRSIASYYRDSTQKYFPFGYEIFENDELSFEPNINIATPQQYILGANDQLSIDIFGISDNTKKLTVSADGFIRYPNLGPVKVAGLNIEEAKAKMKTALAKIYPGIASGAVNVQIALTKLRSIRVTLIGEVYRPGNFELSSLSTIMNALYASGGPNKIGSFRDIELVRNGKVMARFDLYNFLLKSDLTQNLLLADGDVIRISPYTRRILLKGALKKQAYFDVKDNETAADIIRYAGGFADHAFKEWVRVFRMGASNKEILSVAQAKLNQFQFNSGDTLVVDSLANMYANRVLIGGAVYYGGAYSITQIPNLKALLDIAKPKEDVFVERGIIKRLKPDFSPEMIAFNVQDILTGKTSINLQREDSVHLYHIQELREKFLVQINGEVNNPGQYEYADNLTVQDLVLLAKGYKDGATLQNIEISRRVRIAGEQNKDSAVYSIIKEINLVNPAPGDLRFNLKPFDIVSVRKSPVYKEQISVSVEGEVVFPGTYTLAGNAEKISDLIKRAGGLKQTGYAGGAVLIRKTYRDISSTDASIVNTKANLINTQSGKQANSNVSDTSAIQQLNREQKLVGIELDAILNKPGGSNDLILLEGDVLKVPKQLQTIQTFGAVNVPKQIVYYDGIRFKDAIIESGRYSMKAARRFAYAVYPNGQVRTTKRFLFFRSYPTIKPGTEIYVPEKGAKAKLSTGELVGIFSGLTSLVSILIVLINTSK